MKTNDENIAKIESTSTIAVNFVQLLLWLGQLLTWIFSLFTVFVLSEQPQPITLPGILELGAGYKLLFLLTILLGYTQLLRKGWENQKRQSKDIEGTFGRYVYGSIMKWKRPLVVTGYIIILGALIMLIFTEIIGLAFVLIIAAMIAGIAAWMTEPWVNIRRQYDDEYRKRWLKRVKNQLYQSGAVDTFDLQDLPEVTADEVNWAIKMYFHVYEFEKDLIYSEKIIKRRERYYEICEIRFKHVPSVLERIESD